VDALERLPPRSSAGGMREALTAKFRDRVAAAGWHVVVDAQLGAEREAQVDLAILAPPLGVVLVDLLPRQTGAPRAAFWRRLRAAGFTEADRAALPVYYRRLPPDAVPAFPNRLPALFADTVGDATLPTDWPARVERAIAPVAAAATHSPGLLGKPEPGATPAAAEPRAEPLPEQPYASEPETVAAIAAAITSAPCSSIADPADAGSDPAASQAHDAGLPEQSGAGPTLIGRPEPLPAEPVAADGDSGPATNRPPVPRFGFAEDAAFRFPDQPLDGSRPGTAAVVSPVEAAAISTLPPDRASARMPAPPPTVAETASAAPRRSFRRGAAATLLLGAVATVLFWATNQQPSGVGANGATATRDPVETMTAEPLPLPWPPGWSADRNSSIAAGLVPAPSRSEPPQTAPPPPSVSFASAGQVASPPPTPPTGDPPTPVPMAVVVPSPPAAPLPTAASAWPEPPTPIPPPPNHPEMAVAAVAANAARVAAPPPPANSSSPRPNAPPANGAATRAARTAEIGAEATCLDLLRRLQLGDLPSHADLDLLRRFCRPRR